MNDIQLQTIKNDVSRGFFDDACKSINNDLNEIERDYLRLAYDLRQCFDFAWFRYRYKDFYKFCSVEFGLSRSTVSRLINVNKRFCVEDSYALKENFKCFDKSQLFEMVSMSDDDIHGISPDMTVKQIRACKSYDSNNLLNQSDVDKQFIEGECKVVATSQQKKLSSDVPVSRDLLLCQIKSMKNEILNDDSKQGDFASGYLEALSFLSDFLHCFK